MTPHKIKTIRQSLEFGDIATIARETGYSHQTVHTALKGYAMTEATKVILEHAQIIIKQREERRRKK